MSKNRLQNKIALITGASQGIGKAIAALFIEEGATVILTDINDSLGKKEANILGEKALYLHLDVSLEKEWQKVIKSLLEKFGRLDILVNNAGITGIQKGFGPQDPEHLSLKDWKKVHAVNSDGVFLGCKYALKSIKKSTSGAIINISSRSGIVGIPGAAAYAASKAAVRNHTKSVALYCCEKKYPIRCNSIHPGAILTPLWDPMLGEGMQRDKAIKAVAKEIPMGKMGTPKDVAYAALYLASDESQYITGIELTIDGGILAGSAASPDKEH